MVEQMERDEARDSFVGGVPTRSEKFSRTRWPWRAYSAACAWRRLMQVLFLACADG